MKKMAIFAAVLLIALSTAGCAGKSEETEAEKTKTIGIMLTDNGLSYISVRMSEYFISIKYVCSAGC